MQTCTFELIVNILTYAIKNNGEGFSQKDFKNIVYTEEFDSYDMSEKIAKGFEYLIKRGLLQYKNHNMTYYEKYILPKTIKINTDNYTKVFKELSRRIILMYEGNKALDENKETNDRYADIIECVDIANSDFLTLKDKEQIKITLSKILISLNVKTKSNYSLLTIIQLLELKSNIKIEIESSTCQFSADNVRFEYIQFNDESMLLAFDKCSFEINNIDNILNIQTIDELPLKEHIINSLKLLNKYSNEDTYKLVEYLSSFQS